MSERSGGRERSEQSGGSKRVSGASERANGRASGPVLTSVFLVVLDHSDSVQIEDGFPRRKDALSVQPPQRQLWSPSTRQETHLFPSWFSFFLKIKRDGTFSSGYYAISAVFHPICSIAYTYQTCHLFKKIFGGHTFFYQLSFVCLVFFKGPLFRYLKYFMR